MKNYKIGNLRALAILMVVLGHSIILYSPAWTLYKSDKSCYPLVVVLSIIDIIQMPLYFSISGYLFYYSQSKRRDLKDFLVNKVRRLIIPFFISALCWMIPIRCLVSYSGYQHQSILSIVIKKVIWGSDNGHLWFLETLFLVFIVMYFVCGYLYKKNRNWLYAVTWGGLLIVSLFSYRFNRIPIMKNTALYMVWFYTGLLIHHYEQYFQVSKYKILHIVLPIVSIGGG